MRGSMREKRPGVWELQDSSSSAAVAAASGDLTQVDVDELGEVLRRQGLTEDQIRRVRDFVDFTRQRP